MNWSEQVQSAAYSEVYGILKMIYPEDRVLDILYDGLRKSIYIYEYFKKSK